MSFLNKGGVGTIIKPAIIFVAVLLIVGGVYSLVGGKQVQTQSSGVVSTSKINNAGDVEKVIAKWIAAHPEAIIESVTNMQKKAQADQAQNAQKNIVNKKEELENAGSPAVSPEGYDVTIVEFFDYACGYCKKVHATVEKLLAEDKKVRIIFKEYPILGQASLDLSQVAVAVSLVDQNAYKSFHDALMTSSARTKDAAMAIAKKTGVDIAALEAVLKNDAAEIAKILQANSELGRSIGINGTPGFVLGDELIPGALDLASFKAKIADLRNK